MKSFTLAVLTVLSGICSSSSGQSLIIPKDLRLPTDSVIKSQLIASINGFLDQKEKPNKENTYVLKDDLLEMSALLDEFKGIEKNTAQKDDHFYKPYLAGVTDVGDDNFLVALNYMAVADNTPLLRACFKLYAKKQGNQFYFSSPLKQSTLAWKKKKMDYITFYFKDTLHTSEAKAYLKYLDFCDKTLNVKPEPVQFYDCDNFPEAMQLLGVSYKSDYNGLRYDYFSSHENNTSLEIDGGYTDTQRFDRHDTWHDRLHMVMDRKIINRPVDEGCAYLFGGSWGTSWEEIVAMFKKYAADHPDADWAKLYIDNTKLRDDDKPIYICYAINALIVKKIDKEKGFAPVMELLSSGPRVAGDDNYFKALEKMSGISRADFNKAVSVLLRQQN
jgi:hypothetical protein